MTQPNPPETEVKLNVGVGVATTPHGQPIVQIRVVAGPTAFVLELPAEAAQQLTAHLVEQVDQAATAIRRAQLGVPGLIVPRANGARP